jgi:multidrug efflux system membrane fusion protein
MILPEFGLSRTVLRAAARPAVRRRSCEALFWLLTLGLVLLSVNCARKSTPAAAPAVAVRVATVARKDVPLQLEAIGRAQPYSFVQFTAQVGGSLLEVGFKEGQDVRAGDLLFRIDPRPFEIALSQAEAVRAKDEAQLRNAEDDVQRYVELAQKDYVTQELYERLKSNVEVQKAAVQADRAAVDSARLNLSYCLIRSPIDGRTGGLDVYPGNLVRANDPSPLVVINQVVPIYVVFSVPEQHLPAIRRYRARGPLQTLAAPPGGGQAARGLLSFVNNAVDPATGTIELKATFPNADRRLWPGQFLNVVLTLTVEQGVVVIPSQAVQTGQAGQYVMVVQEDMTVQSRPVEVDRLYGEEAVIRSGLKAGEKVVTDGLLRLVPGARVAIKKEI